MTKTFEALEKHLANHTLTDYVKTISDEEISRYIILIYCDDIIGDRIKMLEVLNNEYLYRNQDKDKINKKTTKL